jgi:hypothetical protein
MKNTSEFEQIDDLDMDAWLKFTTCHYNFIIKTNLIKNLYENEESYSVDIVDWIWNEAINIDLEEQKFGNMYGTDYNAVKIMGGMSLLRIMSGMGGLSFSS